MTGRGPEEKRVPAKQKTKTRGGIKDNIHGVVTGET